MEVSLVQTDENFHDIMVNLDCWSSSSSTTDRVCFPDQGEEEEDNVLTG